MSTLTEAVEGTAYRTAPSQTETGMPAGVPYIIGNEAAERFSFYGMRSILIVFMTQFLVTRSGLTDHMTDPEARAKFSYFVSAVYFLPIAGAILAEGFWGKYRTIFWLSLVYCLGHLMLAINDTKLALPISTRMGLYLGLGLIAVGSGGIKPCVSANVGDQFGEGNKHLLSKVFGWFYFSINAGSFISNILCPVLLNDPRFGPAWAFGLPGVAMGVATLFFWLGRKKFVHVPPGGKAFFQQFFSREGLGALGRISMVICFVAVFWALWDQSSGGAWTLQCKNLDLNVGWLPHIDFGFSPFHLSIGMGLNILPEHVQVANPILILLFIPFVNYLLYPFMGRFFEVTPLRKIGIGLGITGISYLIIAHIQTLIDAGGRPSVNWQFLAYIVLTLGEAMVSITGLEFSYTQAPNKMKSAIAALWLFAVSVGNLFTAAVNSFIQNPDKTSKITDHTYYLLFAGLMFVTTVIFAVVATFYRGKTYIQGEAEVAEADIAAVTTRMPA